ncbi:hypothetical protein AJ79_02220 [Helicocarpus griseus UAMH5409]|uniref:RTA1 domain-containing protein n=1 Tax=Helicocarpus griseus UAMH5409 TaxID=1447875 RepID=A0A2B7Y3W3_9EURO|nr:hypothetical protein AJ79_02220 [Helicocarpus griseus UAMH5409]
MSMDICKEVSALCPVEATTLGYYPNLGANAFFCACFGLFFLVAFVIGVWKKTWTFTFAVTGGCALECLGYGGRIMLHQNPWSQEGFKLQIVTIILGPTFLCASIYLTLKHVVLAVGRDVSRIRPRLYTWIFIPCDICCLVLQAIGGGVAASAEKDPDTVAIGNRIIMAGIVLQVIVLFVFGAAALDYYWRASNYHRHSHTSNRERAFWADRKFHTFAVAVFIAYIVIFFRCVYRIAEMAGGWGNHIMRHESSFIVMESVMVLIGAGLLACVPPGIMFPQMCKERRGSDKEEMDLHAMENI